MTDVLFQVILSIILDTLFTEIATKDDNEWNKNVNKFWLALITGFILLVIAFLFSI